MLLKILTCRLQDVQMNTIRSDIQELPAMRSVTQSIYADLRAYVLTHPILTALFDLIASLTRLCSLLTSYNT